MTSTDPDSTTPPCCGDCKCQNKTTNMSDEQDEKLWSDFTQEVTMHGIRYIHLKNASSIARLVSVQLSSVFQSL